MRSEQVLERFRGLSVWSRGEQRAPHKPLLALYALGQWIRDPGRALPFVEVERELTELLWQFGPPRKAHHPEYPFWRLQHDGVWRVQADQPLESRQGNTDPKKTELRAKQATGRFTQDVATALASDASLVGRIASLLVNSHFPETLREDVLLATGLGGANYYLPSVSADFRDAVLVAYEYKCAVTDLDLRLAQRSVGLEAAHIKMSSAGGPDRPANGLALSALHHRLFDRGVFTVLPDLTVAVSEYAHGSTVERDLLPYHGKPIRAPQHPEQRPDPQFLDWHCREIFRGRARAHV